MSAPGVNTLVKAAINCRKVASYCHKGESISLDTKVYASDELL